MPRREQSRPPGEARGFTVLVVGLSLVYGCATSPSIPEDGYTSETSRETAIVENESVERTDDEAREERVLAEPARPPADEPGESVEDEEVSTEAEWAPPSEMAPAVVPLEKRDAIVRWIDTLPYIFEYETTRHDPGTSLVLRRYLRELMAAVGPVDRRVGENALRVTITPTLISDASAKNDYGVAEVSLALRLEGPSSPVVIETVEGQWSLSRVSSIDAQLNSLRRIDPSIIARAVDALREKAAGEFAIRGIPYRIEYPDGTGGDGENRDDGEEVRELIDAVFHSIGTPIDTAGIWQLHAPPDAVGGSLETILVDSPFDFSINPLTRDIRIIYNGGS